MDSNNTPETNMSKCNCGRCPTSRLERGLKCFAELTSKNDGYFTKIRNGYSFATGVTHGRGRDLIQGAR